MTKFFKTLYKVLLAASGAGSIGFGVKYLGDPQSLALAITGGAAIASAASSAIKDKNFKTIMSLVNVIACNLDKAENDSFANS
jgi:predicted RNA methylase